MILFAQTGLAYTPPAAPPPLDPVGVLLRLVGLTLITLVICGGVIWWARRAGKAKLAANNVAGRLKHDGRLALDGRATLHLIRADGQQVVVTTDAGGLRSIVPLAERFDAALAEAEPEDDAAVGVSGAPRTPLYGHPPPRPDRSPSE